jgi:endogenous inhibitor of DNA gyrase (YacG/DUF329 family)
MKRYLCPICKKPVVFENNPFRPFCSERCKLIDLGRWADNKYYIPGDEESQTDDENGSEPLQ